MSTQVLNTFQIFPTSQIPTAGLVAEYLFSNNVNDTSGNGYNGINTNVTFGNDRKGSANKSGVFNGTSAFVNINAALAGLSSTTDGAWSFWVKKDGLGNYVPISFGDTDVNSQLSYIVRPDSVGFDDWFSTRSNANKWFKRATPNPIPNNTWAHVCLNKSGSLADIYVDNVFVSQSFAISTETTSWFNSTPGIDNGRIGVSDKNSLVSLHFKGNIDDVRLYNRALTTGEIAQLYNE